MTESDQPLGRVLCSNDEYHAGPGISKSHLDAIAGRSPLHYWFKYVNPNRRPTPPTPEMQFGTAVHAAILEPDSFARQYLRTPEDAPPRPSSRQLLAKKPSIETLQAAEWWADFDAKNAGKILLGDAEYTTLIEMRDAAHSHPEIGPLLRSGFCEESFYAIDEETGELIKCRVDFRSPDWSYIIDLKTTRDASDEGFGKSSAQFRYPLQPAWYYRVLRQATGVRPQVWAFVAMEKEPPYAMGLYYVEDDVLERAEIAAERDFQRIIECKRSGRFPDYATSPKPLILPQWAKL